MTREVRLPVPTRHGLELAGSHQPYFFGDQRNEDQAGAFFPVFVENGDGVGFCQENGRGEPLSSLLTVILGIIKGADPVVGLRFI